MEKDKNPSPQTHLRGHGIVSEQVTSIEHESRTVAEIERLRIDASNHAADAETVRRERDALICENRSLRDSLAKCRTSYCGFSLSGSYNEAAEIVSRFYTELSRIDQVSRSALSGTPVAFTFYTPSPETKTEDVVMVPTSAIDWLLGEGPDANGEWFERPEGTLNQPYWWRSHFRKLVFNVTPAPQPREGGE